MKIKQDQVISCFVDVLGVTISVDFERINRKCYSADITRDQAELLFVRAAKMLLLKWEEDLQIELCGFSSGRERCVKLSCYRIVDDDVFRYSLNVTMFDVESDSYGHQLVITGGFPLGGKFLLSEILTEQNRLDMFNFSDLDRKFLAGQEVIENFVSEGLVTKQGDFLVFGKRSEKREVINENAI
jgi:hypothetical protein